MKQVKIRIVVVFLLLGGLMGMGIYGLQTDHPNLIQISKGIGCDECGMG